MAPMIFFIRTIILLCTITFYGLIVTETRSIPVSYDQEAEPASHHHGRVHMKVFRGPTTHDHHHHFAPHGYWIKQPADNHHHY